MEQALREITTAITGLYSNPIKDYIFPIVSALFSSALGGLAAYYTVHTQERNRMFVSNIDAINATILSASEARDTLVSIKENYHGRLSSNPYQRIFATPYMLVNNSEVNFNVSALSFMVPSDVNQISSNWQRIEYINTLFKNFNQIILMWNKRNESLHETLSKVKKFDTPENVIGSHIHDEVILLSDLTEQLLLYTDDLLVELTCFLIAFPHVTKEFIPEKIKIKYQKKIIIVSMPQRESSVNMLSFCPTLDFEEASKLHLTSPQEIHSRYKRIYSQ